MAQRILLLLRDMVGDLVNSTGAVRQIVGRFPEAQIVIESGPAGAELFPDTEVWARRRHPGLLGKLRRVLAYRRGGFDRAIVLDDSREKIRLAIAGGVVDVLGVARNTDPIGKAKILPIAPGGHDLFDPLRSILRELGANEDVTPILPLTEAHREKAKVMAPDPMILLHVGASDRAKSWPETNWIRLATSLGDRCLVAAGPGEEALRDRIASTSSVRALPTASLLDYAAIIERMRAIVTADTSAAHLAGAVGTRSVVLYGPTHPVRFAPWRLGTPLWHDLGCDHYGTGCAHVIGGTCSQACMAAITSEEVLALLESP